MLPVIHLYTSAEVSREAYESILRQIEGVSFPDQGYHPRVVRDYRSVEFVLCTQEERDLLLQDLEVPMPKEEEEEDIQEQDDGQEETYLERLISLLGKKPVSIVSMYLNHEKAAQNIAIDFVQLFQRSFACVVINQYGEVYTPEAFADCAEPGYDGYRLDATRTHVVKEAPETAEEKTKRVARVRREKVLTPGSLTDVVFTLYIGAPLSYEALIRAFSELGAEILLPRSYYDAQIVREGRKVMFHVLPPPDVQREWSALAPERKAAVKRALGGEAQNILELRAVKPLPSVNLALDVLVALGKRFACVVQDGSGELHTPEELLEFAQPGFDGYHWDAERQRIVKESAQEQ